MKIRTAVLGKVFMIINIDLIPELLNECGITLGEQRTLLSDHTVKEVQLTKLNGHIILV